MEFTRSLQSEILKIKGSYIIWVTIFGGLLLPIIFSARHIYVGHCHKISRAVEGTWILLHSQNSRGFVGFLIPIGVILICTLITQIEYKNNNWKQVHTTPQRYSTIFFAKFTILITLTILVFALLNIGILINGIVPCYFLDRTITIDPIPVKHFFTETAKCFVLSLPIIGLQYLLSLHFKNFIVAFGVGLTVYVGSMPGIKIGTFGFLSPYSYVLNYFDQTITEKHVWMAFIYFLVLFILSHFMYLNKSEKG